MESLFSPAVANQLVSQKLQTPTVFRNMLNDWPCKNWTLEQWADALKQQKLQFQIGSTQKEKSSPLWESDFNTLKATVSEFHSWIKNPALDDKTNPFYNINPDKCWCYASYKYMSELFKDDRKLLQIVDWGNFGFAERNAFESVLWIGSRGAYTPCHYDTYGYNLVAELIGKKRWILFPPSQTNLMQPSRIPYEESSVFSKINIHNPQLSDYPSFALTTPFVVDLEPGEVLFVPHHWWHFVESLETSVSVNTWLEIKEDETNRLEEAITRTLFSMFVEVYEKDEWLNPNEKLELPDTNMDYICQTVKKCVNSKGKCNRVEALDYSEQHDKLINYSPLAKRHRSSSKEEERLSLCNDCIVPVQQLTFSEYMDLIRISNSPYNNQLLKESDEKNSVTTMEKLNRTQKDGCCLKNCEGEKTDVASSSEDIISLKNDEFKKLFMNCVIHPNVISEIAKLLHKECSL